MSRRDRSRPIASGDMPAHTPESNRLDALRKIAATSPDKSKRRWAQKLIKEILK